MSQIGSPLNTSLIQTAQAQQNASKARDRQRAESDRTKRFADQVDLKVSGVEQAEAIRRLPQNDSEQAGDEHRRKGHARAADADADADADEQERGGLDLKA